MNNIELLCNKCGKLFFVELKDFNRKRKNGQVNFYCSRKCFINSINIKKIKKVCLYCHKKFDSTTSTDARKCCSNTCSSKYSHSFSNPKNISKSMIEFWKQNDFLYKERYCKCCGIKLEPKRYLKCCSEECSKKMMSVAGRKSVEIQKSVRRSKNEILFAELCNKRFSNVLFNVRIFNGWDADVILTKEKIAVLWNGRWHYEKIKKEHSVLQVQNRDKIRLDEIKKMSYTPYIIKDLGKYDPNFVMDEFNKFILFINAGCVV